MNDNQFSKQPTSSGRAGGGGTHVAPEDALQGSLGSPVRQPMAVLIP